MCEEVGIVLHSSKGKFSIDRAIGYFDNDSSLKQVYRSKRDIFDKKKFYT